MDKNKAIELLKQALNEIPQLRHLHYDDQQYTLWRDKVESIIKAGLEPEDAKRFSSSIGSVKMRGLFSDDVYQQEYFEKLNKYETALKSIIQKYEILEVEDKHPIIEIPPEAVFREAIPKVFVSHGKESEALNKLERFMRALGTEPLIVKEQANLSKDLPDKVNLYLSQADFVIILATADDKVEEKFQPRQNVIHEIGLAQKTHDGKIIYLLEEGAQFPSNISSKVWEYFNQDNMENVFLRIVIELKALGILKAIILPRSKV